MDNEFSLRELEEVFLKTTYPIEIAGRKYDTGETFFVFLIKYKYRILMKLKAEPLLMEALGIEIGFLGRYQRNRYNLFSRNF